MAKTTKGDDLMAKKQYKIAEYGNAYGMYETDDFRLNVMDPQEGTFKADKSVKGIFNGHEKGVFTTTDGKRFLVFKDHSAKPF